MGEVVARYEPTWLPPVKAAMWAGLGALLMWVFAPEKVIEVEGPVLIRDKIVVERVEVPTLVPVPVIVEKTTVIERHHYHIPQVAKPKAGKPVKNRSACVVEKAGNHGKEDNVVRTPRSPHSFDQVY